MVNHARELDDQDFVYAYVTEYLDEQLPPEQKERFDKLLTDDQLATLPTDFGIKRGQLQIALQKLYLDESQIHQLHTLVEDDAARADHEAHDIEDLGRWELWGNSLRLVVLMILLAGVVGGTYYFLAPPPKAAFNSLEALMYESMVMMEEPEERLDFPTESVAELRDYFRRYPDLGFRVHKFESPGSKWGLVGGSVIDYEVARIVAAQFLNRQNGEFLFIYMFEGQLDDLPHSEPGNQDGLVYQAYASSALNVIAWQVSENVLGMVMGYRGAPDLAQVAQKSVGRY
jgi:hypothetical protein